MSVSYAKINSIVLYAVLNIDTKVKKIMMFEYRRDIDAQNISA